MRRVLSFIVCLISVAVAYANDGVFYAEGNHLIPITETDIRVQKEVLTLNREEDKIQVTVYYEFYNPTAAKEVLVGFEADGGGSAPQDSFPQHPCIKNFKVVMNGESLNYTVTPVDRHFESGRKVSYGYFKDGHIEGMPIEQYKKELAEMEAPEAISDYVYHFNAQFRPGLNIIQHTYDFDLSYRQEYSDKGFEGYAYFFPYVLTAANRWANHQIDDFTLIVNMGDRTSFHISPAFFESASQWSFPGKGKYTVNTVSDGKEYSEFHVSQGGIKFHKENFHPDGDLYIFDLSMSFDFSADNTSADNILSTVKSKFYPLVISDYYLKKDRSEAAFDTYTPEQRRILKNLPFAYRGYIFNSKELQDFYESTPWYIPNPDYKPDVQQLPESEQNWVEFWSPSDLTDNPQVKEIEKRVTDIYNHVFTEYVKLCDSHQVPSVDTFNSLYFSKDFLHLNQMIGDLEEQSGGPIVNDVDNWICAQDWDKDLEANVLRVKMVDDKKAMVDVNIHNCGNDHKQTLILINERGNWYIDDMYVSSMRKSILEAIEDCKKDGLVPRIR